MHGRIGAVVAPVQAERLGKPSRPGAEEPVRNTATPEAPWVVVRGNKKWFARIIVAATIVDALERLNLQFPKLDGNKRRELEEGRRLLEQAIGGRESKDKKGDKASKKKADKKASKKAGTKGTQGS